MELVNLEGVTKHYKGNGRKLGYPTANIDIQTPLKDGVYFGFASLGTIKNKPALIFIGVPVTIGDTTRRVEAHILDIKDEDYYDQKLEIEVAYFYRSNETFDGIDELLVQMKKDEHDARVWFEARTNSSKR